MRYFFSFVKLYMNAPIPAPQKIYFRNLDSIRFFAAMMVVLQHDKFMHLDIQNAILRRFLFTMSDGETGVSIFFVLSGFLITYLILSEIDLRGRFSLGKFYIRRILRIWPLYFAVVFIAFFIFPALSSLLKSPINQGGNLWYQFCFLSNFDVINIEKYRIGTEILMQNITWSVAIEEQFYAFWPLIFVFLPRKAILPAICFILISSLLFRFYYFDDLTLLYFHTFSAMLYLGTGALTAYLIITRQKVRTFFERMGTGAILILFILLFLSVMCKGIIFPSKITLFISQPFFAILFAFIIASQSMIKKPSALELGNIGFANKLGKYTYGIYLLHPIALEITHIIGKQLHVPDTLLPFLCLNVFGLILTFVISWLSYTYFESKFLNLKKRFAFIQKD